jgi:nucleotidyltransferase/DNA polymerase involved in DNA repair
MPFGEHGFRNFPRAIIHIDGDAFFASCEQARDPALRGKPVITGKERGIAASLSYEAKAMGVTRAMPLAEIKRLCPDAIILPSDYETYGLLSQKFFNIVRRYTPDVEEYGIDECFADITGLRRVYHTSYLEITKRIKRELDTELGFTFSVGLAPTKVLAKVGSKWKKPSGLTMIPGKEAHLYLGQLPVEKVWGIGGQTTEFLAKFRIKTALQFAQQPEEWIKLHLSKPFYELWHELNGRPMYKVNTVVKDSYTSIQKVKTFTPPSTDRNFVFSQLSKNIENACIKARRYKLASADIHFFLRTQQFQDRGMEIELSRPTAFPSEIVKTIEPIFNRVYRRGVQYRSTGITLMKLKEDSLEQPDLFGAHVTVEQMSKVYEGVDAIKRKYGKHTLFIGSSFEAHKLAQHEGERGDLAPRREILMKGETSRRRVGIPMFMGKLVE